jgi:hypothetical protein
MKTILVIIAIFSLVACAGKKGTNGAPGPEGLDGTIMVPIKFCPGTGVYPTVFPEVGFLIEGKLYAVYSANGGYLFEVLPGAYASNAIGNSCSFIVNPDLSITNL